MASRDQVRFGKAVWAWHGWSRKVVAVKVGCVRVGFGKAVVAR